VLDAFGGTRALPGSTVTYRLTAELTGSGSLSGLRLADTVPAGTTYQPGSLTLCGAALTDAADADAGVVANARDVVDASGRRETVLQPPRTVTPGDRLVFVLDYRNEGATPATGFTVTNPIPAAVLYADGASPGAQVSADGGKVWGALASLTVRGADGKPRAAVASDVTHIRWALAGALPAGSGGKLRFGGIVR